MGRQAKTAGTVIALWLRLEGLIPIMCAFAKRMQWLSGGCEVPREQTPVSGVFC